MNIEQFEGKKIALLGFGIENISVAKFLLNKGIDFDVLDQVNKDKLSTEAQDLIDQNKINLTSGGNYLENITDYNLIIRSPGVKYLSPELQKARINGSEISSSTKLFFQNCPAKIVGVSGTKGKGTTSSLIYEIVKESFKDSANNVYLVGNIGNPSFDVIEKVKPDDLVVFELSSFQLQDLNISPHIAVITNVSEDHLDYHKTLEEYRATKANLLKYQKPNNFAVINYDYPESRKLKKVGEAKKYYFSGRQKIEEGAYITESGEVFTSVGPSEEKICSLEDIKLIGRHNLENIAAASVVGKLLGIKTGTITKAVENFSGLPHRLELVREINGIKFYNDSFSTNPTPTIAAIRSFSNPITLILGGSSKGADFSQLAKEINKSSVKKVIVIGVEGKKIAKAIKEKASKVEIIENNGDISQVAKIASEVAAPGSVVLFSPACASFDMFKNYKDRGEKFIAAVNKL